MAKSLRGAKSVKIGGFPLSLKTRQDGTIIAGAFGRPSLARPVHPIWRRKPIIPLPNGYQLNQYDRKLLSSGGFSIVYLARDEDGRPVAIRISSRRIGHSRRWRQCKSIRRRTSQSSGTG